MRGQEIELLFIALILATSIAGTASAHQFLIADNAGTYRDRGPSQAMRTLVCESNGSQRSYCRADARFGLQLTRQLSRTNCVLNRTWGSDQNGVWVSNGCRAEFALNTRGGGR